MPYAISARRDTRVPRDEPQSFAAPLLSSLTRLNSESLLLSGQSPESATAKPVRKNTRRSSSAPSSRQSFLAARNVGHTFRSRTGPTCLNHIPDTLMPAARLTATIGLVVLLAACSSQGTRDSTAAVLAPSAKAAPAAKAATAETAKADRMVCKRIAPTGSRIARKTCRTQNEWEEMARRARDTVETAQRRGASQSVEPGE